MKKTIIFAMLLILAMGLLAGCGEQGIDLKEHVDISFSGADGYGKIEFNLDEEKLLYAVYGEKEDSKDMEGTFATMLLLEEIDIKVDTMEGLSNGDKVKITVTYPDSLQESLDVKLSPQSGSSWTVTVSELKKMLELNPFDSYEVSFSGYNGFGEASVTDNSGFGFTCTFSQDKALSDGDTVTLTLAPKDGGDLAEYCAEYKGFIPTETYREYTVSGLTEIGEIDLFEDIDITVTGYSPFLSVSISSKFADQGIRYQVTGAENGKLTKGEAITIQAYAVDDGFFSEETADLKQTCLDAFGAYPVSDTMTYTIDPETKYYIMDTGEMSEEALAWLISEAKDCFDSEKKDNDISIQSVNYYGYYLQTVKEHKDEDVRNYVYIAHEVTYVYKGKTYTHYNVVRFDSVVMKDGACHYFGWENLYEWHMWSDYGVSDLFYFEASHISANAVNYNCVSVRSEAEA